MTDNRCLSGDEDGLHPRERSTSVAHPRYDSIQVLEVLPDESTDTTVLGENFAAVVTSWSLDWYVVDVGHRKLGDFGLEDIRDVVVEYRYRVRPTHGQRRESHCTVRCLKRCQVPRALGYIPLVVADE